MDTDLPRALSDDERDVLQRLLSADFTGATALRRAAAAVRVAGKCGCGCPSIYFRSGEPSGSIELICEGVVPETGQAVLLFADAAGDLDSMELHWLTEVIPRRLPKTSELAVSAR